MGPTLSSFHIGSITNFQYLFFCARCITKSCGILAYLQDQQIPSNWQINFLVYLFCPQKIYFRAQKCSLVHMFPGWLVDQPSAFSVGHQGTCGCSLNQGHSIQHPASGCADALHSIVVVCSSAKIQDKKNQLNAP